MQSFISVIETPDGETPVMFPAGIVSFAYEDAHGVWIVTAYSLEVAGNITNKFKTTEGLEALLAKINGT